MDNKKAKMVFLKPETHQKIKVLSAETGRKINLDLIDDLVHLGLEEFRKSEKFLSQN